MQKTSFQSPTRRNDGGLLTAQRSALEIQQIQHLVVNNITLAFWFFTAHEPTASFGFIWKISKGAAREQRQ